MHFDEFFGKATSTAPFPFQRRFAEAARLPQFVHVPTGLGKTAAVVLGWLWRRFAADEELRTQTPLRLVYCLPMRVLVEQTVRNAREWVGKLQAAGLLQGDGPPIHVLMGGEDEDDWDLCPEQEAILVGTQDMLLSRALNRGYATNRARWPVQFGLLHSDCLWVFDEVQLMGPGLSTSTQLEAFRRTIPRVGAEGACDAHGCRSVWMSATMRPQWLNTVDFAAFLAGGWSEDALIFDFQTEIAAIAPDERTRSTIEDRWNAKKPLTKASARGGDLKALAREVLDAHKGGTRTIVVVNTVGRARELFQELSTNVSGPKKSKSKRAQSVQADAVISSSAKPEITFLHSRFRPEDREARVQETLTEIERESSGRIVVSTQVIEAGVDLSATTMFTELAPWASLVQRFGRCNRRGHDNEAAQVLWVDLIDSGVDGDDLALPYERQDLELSAKQLAQLTDVGLRSLPPDVDLPFERTQVIRRKDLIELFDTTPDLAGNDIDRFVRDVEDSDVRVFWRTWDQQQGKKPPQDEPAPTREELCPVPIGEFKKFVADKDRRGKIWRWNFLDKQWEQADFSKIAPGQVFITHTHAGGYSPVLGWDLNSKSTVQPLTPKAGEEEEAYDDDSLSRIGVWQTMAEHVDEVCSELETIIKALSFSDFEARALRDAARWHDRGKAHAVFQQALPEYCPDREKIWAKAQGKWKRYSRPHFRHELASALAVLDAQNDRIPDRLQDLHLGDLIAYLAAAHHGRVRLSIRSLPGELLPETRNGQGGRLRRFARGIWDGDELPATELGSGVVAPQVRLSLEPMELGLCTQAPFAGQPSWVERMLQLRDTLGVFRLGYLEAIVRAADMRASRAAQRREAEKIKREANAATEVTARG